MLDDLFEKTKYYFQAKKGNSDDFKKILESEMNYKIAYYAYQDVKVRKMHKQMQAEKSREIIKKAHCQLKSKIDAI